MKMIRNLLVAAVLLAAGSSLATDAALLMSALNANPATNRVVEHQRLQPFPGNLVSNWSGSSGLVVISNVDVGDYNVWIRQRGQSGQIAFSFTITTNDTGTVWVHTNNLSVINVGTYPKTGQAAWSIAAAESRYARKGEAGGAAVTGAELVEASTNNGVVTTLVRTQAVLGVVAPGYQTNYNASATNQVIRASGNPSTKALRVVDISDVTQLSVDDEGLWATNLVDFATGSMLGVSTDGKIIRLTGTIPNNTTGTASGLDATGLGIVDTRRKNSLEAGTNSIKGNVLVSSNASFGTFGINTNNSAIPSLDGYDGNSRATPATGKEWQILFPGGGPQYDAWGNNSYFGIRAFGSDFRGVMFYGFGYPGPLNNLREGDVAVSANALAYGGSGASLHDLPIAAHEIATHIDGPMIALTTWNNSNESRILNETNCWEQLRNFSTNGLLAALTNLGVKPYFHIDSNARWITNTRVSTEMAINYSAFPNSTNFLRYWQTNGWKFSLTVYANKSPTNAYYVGLTGAQAAPGAADSSPAMTPNSAPRDVRTLYRWGFDQIRGSDVVAGIGYHHFWTRTIASLCINPLGESWYSAYANNAYGSAWALGRTNRALLSFQWLTPHIGLVDPSIYTLANVVNHDWADTYPGYVNTGDSFLNWMNVFRAVVTNVVPHLSVGHYGTGPTYFSDESITQTRLQLATAAMTWGMVQLSTPTNQQLSAYLPVTISNMTNSAWISVHQDLTALQNGRKLIRLSDAGATNTSAWAKPIRGGEYAVLLVNEAGTAQNITITAAQLGEPVDRAFAAYDIWNGTNTGFFGPASPSLTINVPSKDSYFLRVRPVRSSTVSYTSVMNGGFARLTLYPSGSAAPQYWEDGFSLASGANENFRITAIDNTATNVTIVSKYQASAISAWTNNFVGYYYSPAGRVQCAASNNIAAWVGAAGASSNWMFNVVFPATNAPKAIGVNLTASTNSGTRYLGPNLTIYQE